MNKWIVSVDLQNRLHGGFHVNAVFETLILRICVLEHPSVSYEGELALLLGNRNVFPHLS